MYVNIIMYSNKLSLFIWSTLKKEKKRKKKLKKPHPFWVNLVQKIKIVSLNWNLVPRLIRICRIQCQCPLCMFQTGNAIFWQIWSKKTTPFLIKFGPKNQNCQFKLKFGTQINSNVQNSKVLFTFSVLYQKHPFLLSMRPYWIR